jgi:hypothetical protein
MDEKWPLLSFSCIRQLKKLSLVLVATAHNYVPDAWEIPDTVPTFESVYIASSMAIVKRISERIPLLEELEFSGGLDLGKAHYLRGLKHLRSLECIYPSGFLQGVESGEEDLSAWIRNKFPLSSNQPIVDVDEEESWIRDHIYREYCSLQAEIRAPFKHVF